jgi:hypothetical protein
MSNCGVLPLDVISSFLFGIPPGAGGPKLLYFPIIAHVPYTEQAKQMLLIQQSVDAYSGR